MDNQQLFFKLFLKFESEAIAFFLKEHFLYKDFSDNKIFKHNVNILRKLIEKTALTIENCNHPIINIFIYEFCLNEENVHEKLEFLRNMTLPEDYVEVYKFYGEKYYDDGRHEWDEVYLEGLHYAKDYLNDLKLISFANSINSFIAAYWHFFYNERTNLKEWVNGEFYDMFIIGKGINEKNET